MIRLLEKHKKHQQYFLTHGPHAGQEVEGCSVIAKVTDDMEGLLKHNWKRGKDGFAYGADKDAAADAGTIAHGLIEAFLVGDTLDLCEFSPESQELGWIAFEKFKSWWGQQNMTFMYAELQLVSHDHEYGGTLDLVARDFTKQLCLIDFKATKSLRTGHGIQVAGGYRLLWNENSPDEPIDRTCILRLPKDGTDIEPRWLDPETFAYYQKTFLASHAAHRARYELDQVCPIALSQPWFRKGYKKKK